MKLPRRDRSRRREARSANTAGAMLPAASRMSMLVETPTAASVSRTSAVITMSCKSRDSGCGADVVLVGWTTTWLSWSEVGRSLRAVSVSGLLHAPQHRFALRVAHDAEHKLHSYFPRVVGQAKPDQNTSWVGRPPGNASPERRRTVSAASAPAAGKGLRLLSAPEYSAVRDNDRP